jgi:hypothetical protein
MITPKIKTLFQFIDYLHSNIENFNQYNDLIKELESLNKVRSNLKPEQNYKDKLQYNKVQAEIENKFKTLQHNTANLIKAKAKELNVCSFENEPHYNFNGVETEIRQLKKNFSNEDLPEIFKHKSQYLEYRSNTHGTFLSLQFFFDELDEIAKSLFEYFKETEQNEFEAFEIKAIPVNSIAEAIQGFKKGQTKFTLPSSFLFNTSIKEQPQNETLPPQPIVKQKPELTINQIALKYVYELSQITRENSKEIARKYGHNSGEKLFQRFTYYSSTANRKGKPIPCTPKKLDNKIKLIESIIELLPTDKQERAKDEVSILKEIYEAEYQ